MHFIIYILFYAVIVLIAAYITPGIRIKSFGTALWIAFLIAILDPTLGWLFTGLLHIVTLGLFWVLGIGFVLRFIAFSIVIRIIESLSGGFSAKGFGTIMAFALVLAILGTVFQHMMSPGGFFFPHTIGWF